MTIQFSFFELKLGKNIKFFEFRLTKMLRLLFNLICFFLLTCCFLEFGKTIDFFRVKVQIFSPGSKYGFVVFYREFTKFATGASSFALVASAVAAVGPGAPSPSCLKTACAPFISVYSKCFFGTPRNKTTGNNGKRKNNVQK